MTLCSLEWGHQQSLQVAWYDTLLLCACLTNGTASAGYPGGSDHVARIFMYVYRVSPYQHTIYLGKAHANVCIRIRAVRRGRHSCIQSALYMYVNWPYIQHVKLISGQPYVFMLQSRYVLLNARSKCCRLTFYTYTLLCENVLYTETGQCISARDAVKCCRLTFYTYTLLCDNEIVYRDWPMHISTRCCENTVCIATL